jgi:uncharacterized protein YdeI (YjbR/CyaY-like superfamily)
MANNVNLIVKKPGNTNGSVEPVELPTDLVEALAAREAAEVLVEIISGGAKYTLVQHS